MLKTTRAQNIVSATWSPNGEALGTVDLTNNATIDTTVTLPHPCIQPIGFVTSPGGAWFAMSNAEDDD